MKLALALACLLLGGCVFDDSANSGRRIEFKPFGSRCAKPCPVGGNADGTPNTTTIGGTARTAP